MIKLKTKPKLVIFSFNSLAFYLVICNSRGHTISKQVSLHYSLIKIWLTKIAACSKTHSNQLHEGQRSSSKSHNISIFVHIKNQNENQYAQNYSVVKSSIQ